MRLLSILFSLVLALQQPIIGVSHRSFIVPHGTQGPFAPGTASGWTSSNSAKVCDTTLATDTASAGGISTFLVLTNFGFSIPSTATISGIKVTADKDDVSGNGGVRDSSVRLLKASVATGSDKSIFGDWCVTCISTATYGGASDLWGATWTPADINNSGFGFRIRFVNSDLIDGTATAGIDCVKITVTY